ncbi:MAG: SDR family oxidoreductase [Actinomycetota bacterium]|nr:SDR family oxidoreductase [Actinomycetota bacterium]
MNDLEQRISLHGKVALVTGGSKGIGLATAAALAAAGASVMLSSRKQDALDKAAAGITVADGAQVATFAANVGDPDAAQACVQATVERLGGLDILVNNAATNPHFGPTIEVDLGRYDKTMQVNVRGPLVWSQAAWRASMSANGGTIINVASIGGIKHGGGIGVYNVTKAALIHLTHVLAAELAPSVRVNALAPGLVRTDFARALWEPDEERTGRSIPLGRIGVPDDIAGAAVFLASDLSSWMTGQVVVVDGGALIG